MPMISVAWMNPDQHVGHDLAEHHLDRPDRHRQQAFHGAALDLAGHRQRGEDQHGHGQDGADQAGHDVEARRCRRVVARMGADLERQRWRIAGVQIVVERGLHHDAERRQRRAGGHRIGGVGRDQHRRIIAAPHRALEAARNFDAEQHLAGQQQIVEFGDIVHFPGEAEIVGVLQRLEDRAAEVAVLLQQHRGRQVSRRGVDGIAEQQQLHHRDHHDHRKRHPVAPQLDEFLDHHRIAAPPEAEPRLPGLAALLRGDRLRSLEIVL